MPIIKSAIKKMRQSESHRDRNRVLKTSLKAILDTFRKAPSDKAWGKASSALDRAVKKNVIHKNKAARLKSRLNKLLSKGPAKTAPVAAKKKSSKK